MKILLTGHRGFIGRHILTALKKDRHDVVGFDYCGILTEWMKRFEAIDMFDSNRTLWLIVWRVRSTLPDY